MKVAAVLVVSFILFYVIVMNITLRIINRMVNGSFRYEPGDWAETLTVAAVMGPATAALGLWLIPIQDLVRSL